MSDESNKVYGIGDKVNVALIDNKGLNDVKFLGVDNRGFYIFEDLQVDSGLGYCVPESSIVFVAVTIKS